MNNKFSKPNKKYDQGFYIVKNKEKFIGDPSKVFYRSSWEKHFCAYCDFTDKIKKWGLENVTIPYQDAKGKIHRYIPDFYIEVAYPGQPDRYDRIVVEIKPKEEITPKFLDKSGRLIPANIYLEGKTFKATQNYEYALKTYQKNLYKWTKAKVWCEKNGLQFKLMGKEELQKFKIMK